MLAFCHVHDCSVTSHLHFMVLKQKISMVHFFVVLWLLLCPSSSWLHHTYNLHKTIVHCASILFCRFLSWWLACHFSLPTFCCGDIVPTLWNSKIFFFPSFQVLFLFFALSSCVIIILFLGVINHVFLNVLYMLVVERMASTNATPIIIKKMVHEQDEFMSSTTTPMGSPPNQIKMGI